MCAKILFSEKRHKFFINHIYEHEIFSLLYTLIIHKASTPHNYSLYVQSLLFGLLSPIYPVEEILTFFAILQKSTDLRNSITNDWIIHSQSKISKIHLQSFAIEFQLFCKI